jgi:hypothetical protein
LVAEQVYNWENNIKPRALTLNLDAPQASDTYMNSNAPRIVRNNAGNGRNIFIAFSGAILTGGQGDDIYVYNRGQGTVIINDSRGLRDVIEFDASIKPSNLLIEKQGDSLIIAIANTGGLSASISELPNKIVIANYFKDQGFYRDTKIDFLRFGDGTEYILNLNSNGSYGLQPVNGLNAYEYNDTHRYNPSYNSFHNRPYRYTKDGLDLYDNGGTDVLEFDDSFTPNDITLQRKGDDLLINGTLKNGTFTLKSGT